MMVLLGKDIELNICILIIFVDGVEFFVFVLLKELKFLLKMIFIFNNFVLFVVNINLVDNILFKMFWEMGCRSFERFFEYVKDLKVVSFF